MNRSLDVIVWDYYILWKLLSPIVWSLPDHFHSFMICLSMYFYFEADKLKDLALCVFCS